MNKLDEVKEQIHQIYLHEFNVVEKYYAVLETLRPYIELAEFVYNSYFNKLDCSEIDWVIKEMELIVRIKEQEQK